MHQFRIMIYHRTPEGRSIRQQLIFPSRKRVKNTTLKDSKLTPFGVHASEVIISTSPTGQRCVWTGSLHVLIMRHIWRGRWTDRRVKRLSSEGCQNMLVDHLFQYRISSWPKTRETRFLGAPKHLYRRLCLSVTLEWKIAKNVWTPLKIDLVQQFKMIVIVSIIIFSFRLVW